MCITVTADKADVYVGCGSAKILKIDKEGQCEMFARITSQTSVIVGLVVHKQLLDVLPWDRELVIAYSLDSRQQVNSWHHPGVSHNFGSRMVVSQNQLVAADVTHRRLTLYSLTGQLIRHVHCTQISDSRVCICVITQKS